MDPIYLLEENMFVEGIKTYITALGIWGTYMAGAFYAAKKYCDFMDKKESLNEEDSRQRESELSRLTEE